MRSLSVCVVVGLVVLVLVQFRDLARDDRFESVVGVWEWEESARVLSLSIERGTTKATSTVGQKQSMGMRMARRCPVFVVRILCVGLRFGHG